MFPQGTHGWAQLGSEISLDETEVFPLWCSIYIPWRFKGLERVIITLIFFQDFALWIWLEKKNRNTGQGWTSLAPSRLWVEFHPPDLRVRCWCYAQATFEEGIEEFLDREQCVQRIMGITWGKMKQESLLVSLFYQFLCVSTPKNKYMELVRGTGAAPRTWCSWW